MDSKDLIIAKISESMGTMLGAKGGQSAMRGTGKEASDVIWPELPDDLDDETAVQYLQQALEKLGIFETIQLSLDETNKAIIHIEISGCVFSGLQGHSGHDAGEQSICYFGFGLIEKSLTRLTGRKYRVQLMEHDRENHRCKECATPL